MLTKPSLSISEKVQEVEVARGVDERTIATLQREAFEARKDAWEEVVNRKLLEWGLDPSALEDDGLEAPSRQTISLACRVAVAARDDGWPPPLRVVPTATGGIVFERKQGTIFETVTVFPDGRVEYTRYIDSQLVSRGPIV